MIECLADDTARKQHTTAERPGRAAWHTRCRPCRPFPIRHQGCGHNQATAELRGGSNRSLSSSPASNRWGRFSTVTGQLHTRGSAAMGPAPHAARLVGFRIATAPSAQAPLLGPGDASGVRALTLTVNLPDKRVQTLTAEPRRTGRSACDGSPRRMTNTHRVRVPRGQRAMDQDDRRPRPTKRDRQRQRPERRAGVPLQGPGDLPPVHRPGRQPHPCIYRASGPGSNAGVAEEPDLRVSRQLDHPALDRAGHARRRVTAVRSQVATSQC